MYPAPSKTTVLFAFTKPLDKPAIVVPPVNTPPVLSPVNLFAVLMAEKLVAVAGKLANALATWAAVAPLAPAVKVRPSKTTVLPAANALNCVLLVF